MRLYPSAWYPFGLGSELTVGRAKKVRAFGTDWCVFRTASGRVGIVHATCCHMGADLTRGRVVGERLRCALHAWEYEVDGVCGYVPGEAVVPPRARQQALAATERYGLVWGFLGDGPPPELPTPEGFDDPLLSRPYVATVPLPYSMIGTNAFDTHHLLPLHHRALRARPEVRALSPRRIRLRYAASVVGDGLYDRVNRALGIDHVEVETECWDGTQLVFYHRRLGAFTLFAAQIVDEDTTRVFLRTGRPRRWRAPVLRAFDRLLLDLHHRLVLIFVFQDLATVSGMHLRPGVLLPDKDGEFIAWHRHFQALPRAAVPE
jgi:phenylpropionate dioxygenase-like ring-hydroxylating dioxygenase large terminal subunit